MFRSLLPFQFHPSMRPLAYIVFCLMVSGCDNSPSAALTIEKSWVRGMPPGASMTAAYAHFRNRSTQPIALTGFASPQYASVELHQSVVVDGVSRMRAVPEAVILPGESLVLEPGGYHLMLIGAKADSTDAVEISVETGTAGRFHAVFPVRRATE